MEGIAKLLIGIICAAILAACGGGKDKAKELIELSGVDRQYSVIVEMATMGYGSRYPTLDRSQVRDAVRENVTLDLIKQTMIDVYANHFDEDELDLMIQAQNHPDQAMNIIMGSKDGRALAMKVVEVQKAMMKDMEEAMAENDNAIVDALDDLKGRARG